MPAPLRLTRAVVEIEQHAAAQGWDRPPRLFALVPTQELLLAEPDLADRLGEPEELALRLEREPGHLTPVEQEDLPEHATLEELLTGIAWPPSVAGAALVVERLMLPPEAEAALPEQDAEALRFAAEHPAREEVRIAVGVLRDGGRECALRMRSHDRDDAELSGSDLVPVLTDALAATLRD